MLPLHEILLRLTVAAALGAIIGIERDLRRRPAGIRTSLFVCLATALFTILSGEIAHRFGDTGSTRIASNIVQGIGFLGAGAILRESGSVVGMTTAATVFVEAAIGMAVGGGFYVVAGYATALVLFGLVVIGWIAQRFNLKLWFGGHRLDRAALQFEVPYHGVPDYDEPCGQCRRRSAAADGRHENDHEAFPRIDGGRELHR